MIDSTETLAQLLSATPLAGRRVARLPIPESPATALAIQISPGELEPAWRTARDLLDTTGRWPLAVHCPPEGRDWQTQLAEAQFFNRFFFEEAENTQDISPEGLLAAAEKADLPAFLGRIEAQQAEWNGFAEEALDATLALTRQRCGTAPGPEEVRRALATGEHTQHPTEPRPDERFRMESFLMAWEQTHCSPDALSVDTSYQDWVAEEDFPPALLLLPTPNPWDALAYVHYFGASPLGSEYYIALGRTWQQRYGAELVAHFGTLLQVVVSRPPATPEEALQLAREQDLAALDTLARPGVALRDHARYLLKHNRWLLHQRP
jgi:hypothetical protein